MLDTASTYTKQRAKVFCNPPEEWCEPTSYSQGILDDYGQRSLLIGFVRCRVCAEIFPLLPDETGSINPMCNGERLLACPYCSPPQ